MRRREAAFNSSRRRFMLEALAMAAGVVLYGCGPEGGRNDLEKPGAAMPTLPSPRNGRPNIVLILADDLGREALGSYGGSAADTPHLDALAAAGLRFDHGYATPKCHPSRAALMTGHYPFRIGFVKGGSRRQNLIPYRRLPQLLSEAGYETGIFGKWHLGSQEAGPRFPREFGFDDYWIWERPRDGEVYGRYQGAVLHKPGGSLELGDHAYAPDILNRGAREPTRPVSDKGVGDATVGPILHHDDDGLCVQPDCDDLLLSSPQLC